MYFKGQVTILVETHGDRCISINLKQEHGAFTYEDKM